MRARGERSVSRLKENINFSSSPPSERRYISEGLTLGASLANAVPLSFEPWPQYVSTTEQINFVYSFITTRHFI